MRYVSPFFLLDIEPGSLFDLPDVIKRRRRELLAQITLDGAVTVDNEKIDLSAARRILADLDDDRIKRHHERVLRNDELHTFLRFGKCSGVLDLPTKPQSFIAYLEPFLIDQFSEVLDRALTDGDGDLISNLTTSKFSFQPESWKKAFRPARRYFRGISENLEDKKSDLKEGRRIDLILPSQCHFDDVRNNVLRNPFKIPLRIQPEHLFLDSLLKLSDLRCLNTLPDAFQDLRNDIANALDGIGVIFYNEFDEEEIAQRISERANRIRVGAKDGERNSENLKVISAGVNKLRISSISVQLKIMSAAMRDGRYDTPDEVVSSVMTIFDAHSLSKISTSSLNSEIIGLTKQLREIGWLIITSFRSTPAAVLLVQECMKLKLSDTTVQMALVENLEETRSRMLASEEMLPRSKPKTENPASSAGNAKTQKAPRVTNIKDYSNTVHFGELFPERGGVLRSLYRVAGGMSIQDGFKVVGVLGGFTILVICIFAGGFSNSFSGSRNTVTSQATPTPLEFPNSRPKILNSDTVTPSQSPTPRTTRPKTGTVFTRIGSGGLGQLEVSNGLSEDALVRLRDVASGKTVREMYVRSKERSTITGISPGDYEVLFATGYDFVSGSKSFASGGSYEKFDHVFTFTQIREAGGVRFKTAQITLDKVLNGNLSSSTVDAADFNR